VCQNVLVRKNSGKIEEKWGSACFVTMHQNVLVRKIRRKLEEKWGSASSVTMFIRIPRKDKYVV
jgi:hypothetical protein